MKCVMTNTFRVLGLLLLTIVSGNLFAQGTIRFKLNTPISTNSNGYVEYIPSDYFSNPAKKHPLMIFISGMGSDGPATDSLQMRSRIFTGAIFPHVLLENGNTPDSLEKFIYMAPQFLTSYLSYPNVTPKHIDEVISYAISHYGSKLDTTRIYLTGNSAGGGPVWDYPGASSAYARRVAAILPFTGLSFPNQAKANNIKFSNVGVWAFHVQHDAIPVFVTNDYVDMINNNGIPPKKPARKTIFMDPGTHDSWSEAFLGNVQTETGLNVYEWLLTNRKRETRAYAGVDRDISLPQNTVQLQASGTGTNGNPAGQTYLWQKVQGPAQGGGLSSSTSPNPTVGDLVPGTYLYRLDITDNAAGVQTDTVAVTVNPPRLQAEDAVNGGGISTSATTDEGGGNHITGLGGGEWLQFSLTAPYNGTFTLRIRAATNMENGWVEIRNATGTTVLATERIYNTQGTDVYQTFSSEISLSGGTQTIRVYSTADPISVNYVQLVGATAGTVLPVKFTLFNSRCDNGAVQLTWKTAAEADIRDFSVQKSADGRTWNTIATVVAAGQSNTERTYTYKDATGATGSQYRVVANELSGGQAQTAVIRSTCNDRESLNIFPNPATDRSTVQITLERTAKVQLSVVDSKGALVHRQEAQLPAGSSQLPLTLSGWPAGTYTLYATWEGERRSMQVVKN